MNSEFELDDDFDEFSSSSSLSEDATYLCDNCGEEIVVPVDLTGGADQTYVEDCPVCCSPSVIHVRIDEDRIDVWAEAEQDRY